MTTASTTDSQIDAILHHMQGLCNDSDPNCPFDMVTGTFDPAKAKAAFTRLLTEARIDELERMDTRRHYGKDYQDSLDELDEYKDKRIAALRTSPETEGETK